MIRIWAQATSSAVSLSCIGHNRHIPHTLPTIREVLLDLLNRHAHMPPKPSLPPVPLVLTDTPLDPNPRVLASSAGALANDDPRPRDPNTTKRRSPFVAARRHARHQPEASVELSVKRSSFVSVTVASLLHGSAVSDLLHVRERNGCSEGVNRLLLRHQEKKRL